jgi:hypothetical protein
MNNQWIIFDGFDIYRKQMRDYTGGSVSDTVHCLRFEQIVPSGRATSRIVGKEVDHIFLL